MASARLVPQGPLRLAGGGELDFERRQACWGEHTAALTESEYRVVRCLALRPRQVVAIRELYEALYLEAYWCGPLAMRALRGVVWSLRGKLGFGAIENRHGQGYLLEVVS